MVYCTKCGTKNEEDATVCVECQQPLGSYQPVKHERRRKEDECFGLPHGGSIVGLIIGIIIILWGVSSFTEIDFGDYFWPLIIVIFGILIVAGALYKTTRRR
ncbi:MAG: zinc ribbon domain-containing protein [Candidatus Bathyarchaeum sp.]|nr:MAG: zinc ribbon domain-containing protein [Candidatus Bathyarchaeum sp.]